MNGNLQDIMTRDVQAVRHDTTLRQVASMMRESEIGDVLVTDDKGALLGILTDRDLVIRGVAEGCDPDGTTVGEICTRSLVQLGPDATVDEAAQVMRDRAIRRIPVVRDGTTVGIVSIGDLARVKDPSSALAQISAAPSNN